MPVSHLGLTVSHIPSATSFYLSALKPLGYRFIAARGDSIGLGVYDADFFLTQAPHGYRFAPTHVAFAAEDTLAVRQCYTAAIKAGALPSGTPGYREDDCNCFNAAVEDLDGNTIEFIWRDERVIGQQQEPILDHHRARPPVRRSQTSRNYARSSPPPDTGLKRATTEPVDMMSSQALFGVVIGAAVGIATSYMIRNEQSKSKRDVQYNSYTDGRGRQDREWSTKSRRSASAAASGERTYRKGSLSTAQIDRYPPVVRTLSQRSYPKDDGHISYFRRRMTREGPGESTEFEAIEYGPRRSSTRRSSVTTREQEDDVRQRRRSSLADSGRSRHDSVVSGAAASKISRGQSSSRAKSSRSQASTVKPTKTITTYYDAPSQVPLPESIASMTRRKSSTARSRMSNFDAYYLEDPDDSDGLGDTRTIVPDDSVSCIGISRSPPSSRRFSRKESVEERRGSIMTLPTRPAKVEYRRGRATWSNS